MRRELRHLNQECARLRSELRDFRPFFVLGVVMWVMLPNTHPASLLFATAAVFMLVRLGIYARDRYRARFTAHGAAS